MTLGRGEIIVLRLNVHRQMWFIIVCRCCSARTIGTQLGLLHHCRQGGRTDEPRPQLTRTDRFVYITNTTCT